ncbi:MAG: AsmA-like C-terminal region-containing protein [Bacteroidota bacterium]
MKKAAKIFFYFLLVILFIFSTVVGYFYTKQDWIKNKTVEQLNQYLNAKVNVEEIGFSIFSHFPYASVVFKNVTINASNNCKDATAPFFLKSKFIVIDFNWYAVFEKEIKIKKINFENGTLNIWEKNGQENYQVFKKSEGGEKLSLEKIVIHQFLVNIIVPDNNVSLALNEAKIKGDFYKEIYNLNLDANGDFLNSEILGFVKTNSKSFMCKGDLTIESNEKFSTKDLVFYLGSLKLQTTGFVQLLKEKQINVDLAIVTSKASLQDLNSIVPILKKANNNLVQQGDVNIKATLFGNTFSEKGIKLKGNLNFENGYVQQEKIFVKDLKCNGDFLFLSKSQEWDFSNLIFSGKANVGSFKGSGKITGKEKDFTANLKFIGNHPLESANLLIEFPYIKEPKGDLRYNVTTEISETNKIRTVNIGGGIVAKNVRGELKNGTDFSVDELFVDFNNTNFTVEAKNTVCLDNDVSASLTIEANKDFTAFNINGNSKSRKINTESLEKIIAFFNEGNNKKSNQLSAAIKLEAEAVVREKLIATNFSSTLYIEENNISLKPLQMNSFGGNINGDISINTKLPVKVAGNFYAENIDISNLFFSLNNFHQDIITHKNIYGTVSGSGKFSFNTDKNNKVDESSILAESDVIIKDGKLKDFSPLFSLSKFINLEELKEIKFDELKNTIKISNRKVVVPKMDISNSVLGFKMEGIHTFDNDIDYHFELFLKELLAKKWRTKQKGNTTSEFGVVVEEDNKGSKLFISMKGRANNPKISYDKLAGRQEIKNLVKEESQTIKNLFKKEYNKNYKDSSTKKTKINHFQKNYFTLEEDAPAEKVNKVKESERIIPVEPEKQKNKRKEKNKRERKLDQLFKEKENKKVETTDDF